MRRQPSLTKTLAMIEWQPDSKLRDRIFDNLDILIASGERSPGALAKLSRAVALYLTKAAQQLGGENTYDFETWDDFLRLLDHICHLVAEWSQIRDIPPLISEEMSHMCCSMAWWLPSVAMWQKKKILCGFVNRVLLPKGLFAESTVSNVLTRLKASISQALLDECSVSCQPHYGLYGYLISSDDNLSVSTTLNVLHEFLEARCLYELQKIFIEGVALSSDVFELTLSQAIAYLQQWRYKGCVLFCSGSKSGPSPSLAAEGGLVATRSLRSLNPHSWKYDDRNRVLSMTRRTSPDDVIIPGRVVRLDQDKIVKFQHGSLLHEARAIEIVGAETSIPVPRVHMTFAAESGSTYIVMSRINGVELRRIGLDSLSSAETTAITSQLVGFVHQLRDLGDRIALSRHIGAWPCGPFRNALFSAPAPAYEFRTSAELADYWVTAADMPSEPRAANLVSDDNTNVFPTVLSHGDLGFRNVLIHPAEAKVVGIIDWDTFGWYPCYWEQMSAQRVSSDNKAMKLFVSELGGIPYVGSVVSAALDATLSIAR